jgi:cell division protein FtsZ
VNVTGGPDLSLAEASDATSLVSKMADPEANVIFGVVTDEAMGSAVKVTVIATGFHKAPRKVASTPVDLTNYVSPQAVPPAAPAADAGGFYRKTPSAKAASGSGRFLDLDVPAFLRRGGSSGGE